VRPLDVELTPQAVAIDPQKPLLIVDIDEVLALFMHGFGRFVGERGYEMRVDKFALFQNIYRQGESEHVDLESGRALFDDFFRFGCEDIEAAPEAAHSLRKLARAGVTIVILTNAPPHARAPRARWLAKHGMDYPLLINQGPKGAAVAALAARTTAPVAFIDDLLGNLDSAAEAAPDVRRFQLVADARLRGFAPASPDRHRRIDHWPQLYGALAEALGVVSS
jgi:hypothetical protein